MPILSARRLAAAFSLACALAAPALAGDVPGDAVKLRFDVAISGLKALQLDYNAKLSPTAYAAKVGVDVKGIAALFADFDLDIEASGSMKDGRLTPASFRMTTTDDDERRTTAVKWDASGMPSATRSFKLKPYRAQQLETAVKPGMPDPLAVLMGVALQPADQLCAGTFRSYSGAEVVDYVFTRLGEDNFGKDKPGAYRGPATRCRLELKPVAGLSEKRLRKWKKTPPVYTIWFAPAAAPGLNRTLNVAVAAEGVASGRKFKAWAAAATLAGKPLNAGSIAAQAN